MKHWIFAILTCLVPAFFAIPASAHNENEQLITHVMKKQFDKPEAPLTVMPISVEGDYAVAGWLQAGRGGRALLQRIKGQWVIAVCGGSGLTQAAVLQSVGMKSDAAGRLASAVLAAEAKAGAEQRKAFDSFEGLLKIDPASGHDGHHDHGQHNGHGEPVSK